MLSAMRIAGIEPILVDVPLREPVHGVHGITAVQRIAPALAGADPFNGSIPSGAVPESLGATVDPDALKRYRVPR